MGDFRLRILFYISFCCRPRTLLSSFLEEACSIFSTKSTSFVGSVSPVLFNSSSTPIKLKSDSLPFRGAKNSNRAKNPLSLH
jgi:hypothetical protein